MLGEVISVINFNPAPCHERKIVGFVSKFEKNK